MLGERLKSLRQEKGLSQRDLAKKLNISASAIAMYETSKREPDSELLKRISEFFGVSIDYLLGTTDIPSPTVQIKDAVSDDPELKEFYEEMKERESLKLLFHQTKNLEDKDIKQILRIIKAIEDEEDRNDG